jgi:hypothetical protein
MRLRPVVFTLCVGIALPAAAAAAARDGAPAVTGSTITYTVVRSDTLTAIAARFGVYPLTIASDNQLDPGDGVMSCSTFICFSNGKMWRKACHDIQRECGPPVFDSRARRMCRARYFAARGSFPRVVVD